MLQNLKDRDNLVIRFFQLPLSLWTMLLDPSNGMTYIDYLNVNYLFSEELKLFFKRKQKTGEC